MSVRVFGASSVSSVGTRLALVLMAGVLALSTLVSALVIETLHDHDCAGEGCPTCLVLEISSAVLALVASAPTIVPIALVGALAFAVALGARGVLRRGHTPVSLKVKLVI